VQYVIFALIFFVIFAISAYFTGMRNVKKGELKSTVLMSVIATVIATAAFFVIDFFII